MTPDDDNDEARLRQLFESTAEDASGPLLTRLSARAADVPAVARKARWHSLWLWMPGLVGAGALALAIGTLSSPGAVPAVPRPSAMAVAPTQAPSAPAVPTVESPAPEEELPPPDAVADLGSEDTSNAFAVGALDEPAADDDLDAWLYATGELLDNGG